MKNWVRLDMSSDQCRCEVYLWNKFLSSFFLLCFGSHCGTVSEYEKWILASVTQLEDVLQLLLGM